MTTLHPDLTPGTWTIDPAHTTLGFTARHLMVSKVRGKFNEFEGTAVVGEDLESTSVTATVQMESIDTRNEQRDGHLRTNDFFDVANHPTMTFRSTKITADTVEGELTLRGITQPVTFDVEYGGTVNDPNMGTRAGFEATTQINRKDFGVQFNATTEGGGAVVSDKIKIELDVEFVKSA
ncbi:YceI family protein [Luteipulveratus sp. YIM 133132]|uniref:YceI family protein n=1 Tax=Luteipulveratus flavus TaxID=3031728 RepID=A0ABT6C721_9MICO|nr:MULTISPECIES: YceI family protein [unclassified Luteipulveratus]MDE9365015.1 YceI family protein [Luteipulveratus sp. YIM 133132]MDF8264645.1 YceI family protein [Luteipulveratus sp. YIM 133296]